MFNIFTIVFLAIVIGFVLAAFMTRQTTPEPIQMVPPEDDLEQDPKNIRALEFEDLFCVGEKLAQENGLTIKEKVKVSEDEYYWVTESQNAFFFGNYVLGFYKTPSAKSFVSLPTILEFKDLVKGAGSTKGLFFSTGYFTKDVLQPLEGPKVNLFNRLKVISEIRRLGLSL